MNFIHASDFHLGYNQYGLRERFIDYAIAFRSVIDHAIGHRVEFILISGDLFHKRNINAPTYEQAYKVLSELKEKSPGTSVYAIEGNHDQSFHQDGRSWLEVLNSQGLLKLIRLKEANGVKLMGDYVELDSVRIFGVRYLGSNTLSTIPVIADEIRKINSENGEKYTILMMHFGIEGQIKQAAAGEIPYNALLPLKEVVDYLALGHYHTQYELDGWIFNPGSVEMISMNEYGLPKGFYHVKNGGKKLISPLTRPVRRIRIDIGNFNSPEELYKGLDHALKRQSPVQSSADPLVELILYGEMNFPKSDVDTDRIKDMVAEEFNPLWSEVKILKSGSQYTINESDVRGLSREQIELRVFSEKVKLDGRYRDEAGNIVNLMIEVKKMAASGVDESAIQKEMRWCFEKINNPQQDNEMKDNIKNDASGKQKTLLSIIGD